MDRSDLTIALGLRELTAKAKYYRTESDRFERLAEALREAEIALQSSNGNSPTKGGRPANDSDRQLLNEAFDSMPDQFSFSEIKDSAIAKGMTLENFRRLFRELREQGMMIEKVKATGRRDGLYEKKKQAAPH